MLDKKVNLNTKQKNQITNLQQIVERKNKDIEVKSIKIKNKNKEIINQKKYIEEMKAKVYGINKQIVKKDLKIKQVEATSQDSKVEVEKVLISHFYTYISNPF